MNFRDATCCLYVRQFRRDRDARSSCTAVGVLGLDETTIDRAAMGRLAKALAFVCGADHPTVTVLQRASESGVERDIKQARVLFMRLKPAERKAALAMLND